MDALIPPPRDDDDEDVYLALQTAKALWSRNEREDALRWLRRAAEQASDANADDRALELFKAAADMASRLQAGAAPAAPSTPPAPPARSGGPPPPPNRPPVELAPGPRGAAAAPGVPGAPPGRPPGPPPQQDARPPLPRAAQASTAPPPPHPHLSSVPPAPPTNAPPPGYGQPQARASNPGGYPGAMGQGGPGGPGAGSPYDVRGQSPVPPPARPAPMPSRPPGPMPAAAPQAVPLLRPKQPGATPATPGQRPQAFTPAPPPGRPTPAQPQVPQIPQMPADGARGDEGPYRRAGTMIGPGAFVPPVAAGGPGAPGAGLDRTAVTFEAAPMMEADFEDDSSDAPTKVGQLAPELRQQLAGMPQARPAPAPAPHTPHSRPQPPPAAQVAAAPPAQPRKTARRRTLSRGEQSPLAPGRKPSITDGRGGGHAEAAGRGAQADGRGGGHPEAAGRGAQADGRGGGHPEAAGRSAQADGRGGHGEHRGAPAADARRARDGAGRHMPSEVPTAPGNDARAGAARAAALRALAVADDEVTAQRDVGVLQRLRELRVDDLDEDTSVLPGLKLDANGRAIGVATGGREGREPREGREGRDVRESREPREGRQAREGRRLVEEEATRSVSERELSQRAAASRHDPYTAASEDDRPTPTDAEQDLSATVPPDTSRTSAAAVDAVEAAASMDNTGRYSAIDAMWITSSAAADSHSHSHGRLPTMENPAMAAMAAAADAAVVGAQRAKEARSSAPVTRAPAAASPAATPAAVSPAAAIAATPAPGPVTPAATAVAPWCAFRVVVLGADPAGGGAVRIAPLAPGARPPAGATLAMIVPTTEAESAALARLFGFTR